MKNKMLALGAAVLLVTGLAFGFAKSNGGDCCNVEASTCCGIPCPAPDQCPVPCCESESSACCAH